MTRWRWRWSVVSVAGGDAWRYGRFGEVLKEAFWAAAIRLRGPDPELASWSGGGS